MNIDKPAPANAPLAPGNTGAQPAENADPDTGFSPDLADLGQQPAPAVDLPDTPQPDNSAEDIIPTAL